ncbi:amino acid kinase family protein [Candidatus Laterigemmans baculatus]|uniref:hypothetical protein n=1 Tax=Candidatus Laterigemmans baculatus TaxID=2770505 RepID=UPI0013DB79B4|nr:hypothetical protein [Candidatus Laterigemmans baculatus]
MSPMVEQRNLKRRVVKLGGSLLSNPRLTAAVGAWLARQPAAQNLVVVGGGETVEAMRNLSRLFPLDDVAMHWRCVRLLRATFEIFAELFPDWQPVAQCERLEELLKVSPRPGEWLIAVDAFYSPGTHDAGLPVGWETTTDAIAAYLARLAAADELVLLKSCPIPAEGSPEDPKAGSLRRLTEAGIVDRALATALPRDLPLRVEQLP